MFTGRWAYNWTVTSGGGGLEAVYVRYERGNSSTKEVSNDEIIIKQKTSNDPLVIQHNLCLHLLGTRDFSRDGILLQSKLFKLTIYASQK